MRVAAIQTEFTREVEGKVLPSLTPQALIELAEAAAALAGDADYSEILLDVEDETIYAFVVEDHDEDDEFDEGSDS
jgi:hypothetical protein